MSALSSICATFSILVGMAVLSGWAFEVQFLKTVIPGFVAMKANTALGFILSGASLMLLAPQLAPPGRRWLARLLALAVCLIGLLTLGQELFGWNLGIDELLFNDADALVFTSAPGRMAVASTIAFFLFGLGLLSINWTPRRGPAPTEILALLVIAMSLVAAIAYVFARELSIPFLSSTRMAVHTFITFFVLSVGLLVARPQRGLVGALRARIKSPLEGAIYGSLLLSLLALLVTGAAGLLAAQDSIERSKLTDHTQEVRRQLVQLLSAHQGVQSASRGYAMTGDPEFLRIGVNWQRNADLAYMELRILIQDNPAQSARLGPLDDLRQQIFHQAEWVIESTRSGNTLVAAQSISESRKTLLDFRDVIAQLDAEEVRLLGVRAANEQDSYVRLKLTVGAGTLLALLVLVFAAIVVRRQIDQRQRAELALLKSEAYNRSVVDSSPDCLKVLSLDARLAFMAPQGCRIMEIDDFRAFENADWLSFWKGADHEAAQTAVSTALAGEIGRFQGFCPTAKGSPRWWDVLVTPILGATGDPEKLLAVSRDITEQKRMEDEIREINENLDRIVRERTAALHESEARLHFSLKMARTGGWDLDLVDHSAHRTLEHDQIFGYAALLPQWTYEMFLEHVVPEDRGNVDRDFRGAITAQTNWDFECRIRRADGELRWIRGAGEHQRDDAGRARRMAGIVQDITKRKQAEQRVVEARAFLRQVIDLDRNFIFVKDREGRFTLVNQAVAEAYGTSVEDLIGKSDHDFNPNREEVEHFRKDDLEVMDSLKEKFVAEERITDASGRQRWLQTVKRPVVGAHGRAEMILGVSSDITERKQAETKIRRQLEHLNLLDHITRATGERQDLQSIFQVVVRSLEDSLPVDFGCVLLHDPAANALKVSSVGVGSAALARELTMDTGSAIGVDANGLGRCMQGELVYEPDIGQVAFPFPRRLAGAGLRSLVLAPLRSESRVFGVLVVARRQANAFESVQCEFLRQLSEHVALAAQQAQLYGSLQQAYDELRQTQEAAMQQERLRALGQMASGVAHDINNALSPVSLYTESLLETEKALSERGRGQLETIQRAVDDVAKTLARMREFYREREQQAELAPVETNQVVQQVLDLTKVRWSGMAQQHGVTIRAQTELAANLPRIMGVESELREALTNLVFNAVDAMPEGGTLTLRTRLADDARVVIEVADEGTGMDEETRRRCLEPFFTTKGERGTGLGLAMVFGMLRRHGAQIEIDSAPDAGTKMRMMFAASVTAAPLAGAIAEAPAVRKHLRLLIVDDDPIVLRALRHALEIDAHRVSAADGGQTGIDAFREALARGEAFDAVFTDLGMPNVDGRKVAAAVKEASPSTPVILLTGWGERIVAEGDIPAHVDQVLAKPAKLREVRTALTNVIFNAVEAMPGESSKLATSE